jgi:anti-sigma factor RsiW
MEVTRNVIIDLMPLYLANEVSADTRALVEKYLETDPELAEMATQSAGMGLLEDIPVPLTEEDKMEAYKEAQRLILRRTVIWAGLIALGLLAALGLALLAYFMLVSVIR